MPTQDENEIFDEAIGYCLYCKEEIKASTTYVVKGEDKYHSECYKLIDESDEI